MNNINTINKKAVIPYILAGYPNMETSKMLILALQKSGVSLIELGIPFSDPVALDKTLENANVEAVRNGINLGDVFNMLEDIKDEINIPIVFSTYLNPVFVYGYEKFCKKCLDVGVKGLIVLDLPFEEQNEIRKFTKNNEINLITVVAPTSYNRIETITKNAEGFIYLIGNVADDVNLVTNIIKKIRKTTETPIYVNFNNDTTLTKKYKEIIDGIIIEGKIMEIISKNIDNPVPAVENFIENEVSKL